jgi:hypothetical protein
MRMHATLGASAVALGLALASGPALAQWGNDNGYNPSANPRVGPGFPEVGSAYVGPPVETNNLRVVVPQLWLADAVLFIANAQNAANILAMEQPLNAPAPQVLAGQARFLTQATNRALYSLLALQQNAEAMNPRVVPSIRAAVGHLVAAQAQSSRVEDAAASGMLGPSFEVSVRSALGHLVMAQRWMAPVGSAFGVPQITSLGARNPVIGGTNAPGWSGDTNAR